MAINLDRLVGFHHTAVQLRTDRMEVIAGNLANANTPGYKAQDIDFNSAMDRALKDQRSPSSASGGLVKTHENHMSGGTRTASSFDLKYRVPEQPDTGDGNTVEVQAERNRFLDTGMRYQASVEFLNGKIKGMKKALSSSGGQ